MRLPLLGLLFLPTLAFAAPATSISAHDIEGQVLQGHLIKPGDADVKVLVLDFWASWCGPCRESLPFSSDLLKTYSAKGVRFVGVNEDDRPEDARAFMKDVKFDFPAFWDKGRALSKKFEIDAIPTLVILDAKGKVLAIESGFTETRKKELAKRFETLAKDL